LNVINMEKSAAVIHPSLDTTGFLQRSPVTVSNCGKCSLDNTHPTEHKDYSAIQSGLLQKQMSL
jgi:hypothetical protein